MRAIRRSQQQQRVEERTDPGDPQKQPRCADSGSLVAWSLPYPLADRAQVFERNMRTLTDRLLAQGVVPLLTTMPPDGDFFRNVPVFSGVVRGIAQGRQVPLIDYYRELMAVGPPPPE